MESAIAQNISRMGGTRHPRVTDSLTRKPRDRRTCVEMP
jgi:hypothetical protein